MVSATALPHTLEVGVKLVRKTVTVLLGKKIIPNSQTDIDECAEGTHNCDQTCTNTNGGFNCSCPLEGYVLHLNEATCSGQLN
jgi:hypothetical protein